MTELLGTDLQLVPSRAAAEVPTCILIVAAEPAASNLAEQLRAQLCSEVDVVAEWSRCGKLLQTRAFSLVLLEESLAGTDPEAVDSLYSSLEDGWILEINFGVSDSRRILRHVRGALRRKARNEAHTQAAMLRSLRSQLTSCLTGLLLETQLALRQTSPDGSPALQRILGLAERLSELVQSPAEKF